MRLSATLIATIACLMAVTGALQVREALAQSAHFEYRLSTGFDISSGDFARSEDTDLVYLPTTLRVDYGRLSARATMAYLAVSGPSGAVVKDGVFSTVSGDQRGFGDVVLAATWSSEFDWYGLTYVDATAAVKLPTADESRGLGTGAVDYTLKLELLRSYGNWTPLAAIGYRILGDSPTTALRNTVLASVGMDYRLNGALNVGGLLDWREPATQHSRDMLEIVPYASWKIGGGFSLTGYATVGLADGSPDTGFGMQISYRFGRR